MRSLIATLLVVAVTAGVVFYVSSTSKPAAKMNVIRQSQTDTAIFAGGCFWGLQAAFGELPGVVSSRVGYTGGTTPDPTYSKVVTGSTGHAEATEVTFDPEKISFADLVQFHLDHVRPSKGKVDPDYATKHYRQSIFVRGPEQRSIAENVRAAFNESAPVDMTKNLLIEDASVFWEAEAEHQNYLAKCAY
jgi:methionine-S-sulfoxide reductase